MPIPKNKKGLTIKQDKFCRNLVKSGNQTKAAIEAGYSKRSAKQIAAENMTKPAVAEEVERLRLRWSEQMDLSIETALNRIAHIAEDAAIQGNHAAALKGQELLVKAGGGFVERSMSLHVDMNMEHLMALRADMDSRARATSQRDSNGQ